jgi:hypothetical protein
MLRIKLNNHVLADLEENEIKSSGYMVCRWRLDLDTFCNEVRVVKYWMSQKHRAVFGKK